MRPFFNIRGPGRYVPSPARMGPGGRVAWRIRVWVGGDGLRIKLCLHRQAAILSRLTPLRVSQQPYSTLSALRCSEFKQLEQTGALLSLYIPPIDYFHHRAPGRRAGGQVGYGLLLLNNVDVSLRERNAYAVIVKLLLDFFQGIEINTPIVIRSRLGPED